MNSIYILPEFIDVYLSYLKKLLEAGHKEKVSIYEFSKQYFESKVYERQGKYAGKEIKSKSKRLSNAGDFTSSDQFEILLPEFSYESFLILPAVPSSFDTKLKEVLSDPIIQNRKKPTPLKNIQDSAEIMRYGYPTSQDKFANVIQQKPNSEKVLKRITEFSHLLPGYLRAISDCLEFLDRGEPSKKLQSLSRKVGYDTVQFEHKIKEDTPITLVNDSQTIEELNEVMNKSDVSCQSEYQDTAIYTGKGFREVKTFETVETQTLVIGSWPCKHCYELSEGDNDFAGNPFSKQKSSPIAEPAETSSKSDTFLKASLKSILNKIKSSQSEPGSREGIDIRKYPPTLQLEHKHFSEELITSNKLSAECEGGFGDKFPSKKDTLSIQCAHQSTIKLRLKIRSPSKSMEAKLECKNVRPSEGHTIYNKSGRGKVSVSINGRSWLRTYLTVRMIKKFENENSSWKLNSKDRFEDLGKPVLMPHTYKTESKYNFLSYSFLLPYNFLSSIRLWYFARKLRKYEDLENLEA